MTKTYLRQEYREAVAEAKCRRPPRDYPGPLHRDIREYHAAWKRIRRLGVVGAGPDPVPAPIAGPRRAKTSGSSRFRGVYRRSNGRWETKLRVGTGLVLNRTFAAEEDAARAYDAAVRTHGLSASLLNFPEEA
jgi:hypothetical protein